MMDSVLSGSLLVVFSLFCYATCFFRANKLSLSLSLSLNFVIADAHCLFWQQNNKHVES